MRDVGDGDSTNFSEVGWDEGMKSRENNNRNGNGNRTVMGRTKKANSNPQTENSKIPYSSSTEGREGSREGRKEGGTSEDGRRYEKEDERRKEDRGGMNKSFPLKKARSTSQDDSSSSYSHATSFEQP